MKRQLGLFVAVLLLNSSALFADSIDAPGKVIYKMPDDRLVTREVTLEVPARGDGDVKLKTDDLILVASRFFSKERAGRTVFYVVFDNFPGQNPNELAVFRGTYNRGVNLAIYYGDLFIVNRNLETDELIHTEILRAELNPTGLHDRARYAAGFYFSASGLSL